MRGPLHTRAGLLVLALGWLAIVLALGPGTEVLPDVVVDERHVDFAEDDDGRLVAAVDIQLVQVVHEAGTGVQVRLAPSAIGPLVEPVPGFRGVHGGNLQTAREFQRLVRGGGLSLRTQRIDGAPGNSSSAVTVTRTETLAERRRLADGRFDYAARSEPLPVLLSLAGDVVGHGCWRTEVHVDGCARLIVDFEWDGGSGRLLAVVQPPGPAKRPTGLIEGYSP